MNLTASCDYFMRGSIAAECSGHGSCVAEAPNEFMKNEVGKCVCEAGWRGDGDLMNAAGLDCHINDDTLAYWWLGNAFGFIFQTLFSLYCLHSAWTIQGKAFMSKKSNKSILLAVFFGVVRVIDAFLRFALKKHAGNSLVICIIHSLGGYIFWGHLACLFCEQFLNIVIKQAKLGGVQGEQMKKKCEKMHKVMKLMLPMAVPAYGFIIVGYFDKNPSHHKVYSVIYYVAHCILSFFLVNIVALPVAKAFYVILLSMPEESQDDKTKALQEKMKIFIREVGNAGHFNTLCTIAFMVFPFLWDCQTYQIAFAWPSAIPILCVAAFIVKPTQSRKVAPGRRATTGHTDVTTTTTTSE
mmetsp:Transcript_10374/g.20640  ORF Transcript_10374/g.20640 Transcript_10374/m.20640 type:complete len:354 (-) Transcript_10374:81-1142(-)|eukprot:CAMPEP_0182482166 /NCGR_PEP_ID=MMETSP1319-20130603/38736_1 /TAXON_ID=172717 /ORGANISM="Bolidomonas pacifica, Strain RCC208" /LENGTH=353 /DNA_ID=CAMNT_0024683863 /DNA_START=106 /DNA_END=1167 /DNA_ORIENTATION=-